MATRSEKERQKVVQDKCQAILSQLLRDEDNKYCVDCDAKGPRWASWNLGIFLCIRCAGIHRNLGVHISKVKSVNLDTWTPEQVACLQQMGNSRARAVYEANLPDSFRRPHTDSSLEAFIRAKYEQKKYIAKEWVPPPMPKPAVPNAIPAPKLRSNTPTRPASSPTPPPISSQTKTSTEAKATPKASATVDLLGLDDPPPLVGSPQNSDPFGSYLSAADNTDSTSAVPESTLSTTANSTATQLSSNQSGKSEEENFFSQTSLQESQKKQAMTKESILSLYGQSSAQHQPVYGMPGNMYLNHQQSFPAQQVAMGYSSVPAASTAPMGMVPNGMMSTAAPVGVVTNGMMPSTMANSSLMGNVQLPPQMANLTLASGGMLVQQPIGIAGPGAPAWSSQPTGHTLSTNLWQ